MKVTPPASADLSQAEALLGRAEGSGFAEPWQAEAFACTLQLSRQGLFPWAEWVEVFSVEIKTHPARPDESDNAAYYRQWLAALETLLAHKGVASGDEIAARQEAWRQAYLNTPHGQPVELAHDAKPPAAPGHHHHHDHDHPDDRDHHGHDHHGHAAPKPVAISPAVSK
jgi:nitrile hydratase accessory protein